jgi:Protein kinase domain
MIPGTPKDPDFYAPDHRLTLAYAEATQLDEQGLEALCPSYIELAEANARYRDDSLLGQGAVKDVHRTYDCRTKRWVAIARLRQDRGPEYYDLFVHEAWLTSSLKHPNIIKVHDAGVDDLGRPFFTMDLKGNTSLADLATDLQQSDLRGLLEIFIKVCDAVAYAHSCGVIHLDLKPENIQTDAFGEVIVCDWGLGKAVGQTEDGENEIPEALRAFDNITLHGQIKGTPGYMAPEQAESGLAKDQRTDIFALGCILYLILAGQPVFTGSTEKILEATIRGDFTPPSLRFPSRWVPESLEAVVMKAIARHPDERYSSVLALKGEIQKFLGGFSTLAEKPGFFREAKLFLARNRLPATISFLSIVAITVLSMLYLDHLRRQQQATAEQRERATRFATKADAAAALYLGELSRSEEQRKDLAQQLATSANHLKDTGIFVRPLTSVRAARRLADTALALDPKCSSARAERFSLNCITLNFHDALAHPPPPDSKLADFLKLAKAFPQFEFGEKSRPSIKQFSGFLRQARELDPRRDSLVERMVSYDFTVRGDKTSYSEVVGAMIEYLNKRAGHLSLVHDAAKSSCFLKSDKPVQLLIQPPSGSGQSFLHFLPFNSLKLEIAGKFDLSELHGLAVESLDLRGCSGIELGKTVSLPRLRELLIRPGQLPSAKISRLIKSSGRIEIIEDR